jgi:hypothetical protein
MLPGVQVRKVQREPTKHHNVCDATLFEQSAAVQAVLVPTKIRNNGT